MCCVTKLRIITDTKQLYLRATRVAEISMYLTYGRRNDNSQLRECAATNVSAEFNKMMTSVDKHNDILENFSGVNLDIVDSVTKLIKSPNILTQNSEIELCC